jgi:hypothetical protein
MVSLVKLSTTVVLNSLAKVSSLYSIQLSESISSLLTKILKLLLNIEKRAIQNLHSNLEREKS